MLSKYHKHNIYPSLPDKVKFSSKHWHDFILDYHCVVVLVFPENIHIQLPGFLVNGRLETHPPPLSVLEFGMGEYIVTISCSLTTKHLYFNYNKLHFTDICITILSSKKSMHFINLLRSCTFYCGFKYHNVKILTSLYYI